MALNVFSQRRRRLASVLIKNNVSTILISKPKNIFYLTGLFLEDAMISVSDKAKAIIFSDPRYKLELSKATTKDISSSIYEDKNLSFLKFVYLVLRKEKLRTVAIEDSFSLYTAQTIKKYIPKLITIHGSVEALREIKDKEEIALIHRAAKMARAAMGHASLKLEPNITEQTLAFEIKTFILEHSRAKADLAFDTLVNSGPRTSLPHGLPSSRKIKKDEYVLIDLGVKIGGYNSDLTRALSVGRISDNDKKILRIVSDAQRFAIDKVKPGRKTSVIDKAARDFIEKKGYGKFFIHATGHGIGLDVHEGPIISSKSRQTLRAGMVFTIEPAIYIPGVGGVRVEDMILVTEKGFRLI